MKKRHADDEITPPSSTVRKIGGNEGSTCKVPLSPELSSPIVSSKAKKHKSNGNLTLQELLRSLESRRDAGEMLKKPPYSYATLIGLAILQSRSGKLTLSQIYNWISVHFPYYSPKDAGWQNSIRHNLSLNEAFIKTDKSCDGKGHFWEVKTGYETRFFKGETGPLEDLRRVLQNIDTLFDFGYNEPHLEQGHDSEDDNELLQLNSSPAAMPSHVKLTVADFSEPELRVPEGQKNNYNTLSPPYPLKKFHTSLGLPRAVTEGTPNALGASSSAHMFLSSQDFKRYTCSFNSSFEEISPAADNDAIDTLLDPVLDEPFQGDCETNPREQESASQPAQADLLRTPKTSQKQTWERTPCRFITTPKDAGSTLKRWQTPSHLFEDLYCSPIFKCLGETPSREADAKMPSPRRLSAHSAATSRGRSKFSAGGLFGVDVYAVWKRATEDVARKNADVTGKLEQPFQSRVAASEEDSEARDNEKGN